MQKGDNSLLKNKKGFSAFHLAFLIIAIVIVLLIFNILSRNSTNGSQNASNFFGNLGGMFSGLFSYAGYEEMSWGLFFNHFPAIIIASLLLTGYIIGIEYFSINILEVKYERKVPLGKQKKKIFFFVFAILMMIYLILAYVPFLQLLRPLLLPLFSDYGYKLAYSYENLIQPLLSLLHKEAIDYNSTWAVLGDWFKILIARGILLSIWIFLPVLILYFAPKIIPYVRKQWNESYQRPIEEEKALRGGQKIIMGSAILKAIGDQAGRK